MSLHVIVAHATEYDRSEHFRNEKVSDVELGNTKGTGFFVVRGIKDARYLCEWGQVNDSITIGLDLGCGV